MGALNGGVYRYQGREYALPQHGFARRRMFVDTGGSSALMRLRLADDAETRAVYPFAFLLEVEYALTGTRLQMAVRITNTGDVDMPASFGFHPGFVRGPEEHEIVFERDEPAMLRRIAGGLIGPADRPSPVRDKILTLTPGLFDEDALVWERIESRSLRYGAKNAPGLQIDFKGAPTLGIWSKPGAPFVCVEPWWGMADPVGFTGEIWDKPGIMRFAPGEARIFMMSVTLPD